MPTPNQPTQAEKRKHRYQIEIGDRVEMIHRDDPYHPGRDSSVGQVGTVIRVTDGAWGERVEFKTDDGRVISASSGVVIHAEDPTPPTQPALFKLTGPLPFGWWVGALDALSEEFAARGGTANGFTLTPITREALAQLEAHDRANPVKRSDFIDGWEDMPHLHACFGLDDAYPTTQDNTMEIAFSLDAKAAINNQEITFMNLPTSLDDWAMIVCLEHQDYWIEYSDIGWRSCNGSDGPGYTIFGPDERTQFVGLDLTDAKIELARWILGGAVKQEPTPTQRFAIMLMSSRGAPACMLPNGERVCLTVAGGKESGLRSVFFYHSESEAEKVLFDAHQAVINKDNWPAGYDSAGLADRIDSAVIVSMQVTA